MFPVTALFKACVFIYRLYLTVIYMCYLTIMYKYYILYAGITYM